MTDPVPPIWRPDAPRRAGRRQPDEAEAFEDAAERPKAGLPMVIDPQPDPVPPRSKRAALAAFAAQLLGQGGQKRGLRGGQETLDKARNAYLETEWSGRNDRRPRAGRITKSEI